MDLHTAISLVADDIRQDYGVNMTDRDAVDLARGCSDDDVDDAIDDRRLRKAYHLVLDATDGQIDQALG